MMKRRSRWNDRAYIAACLAAAAVVAPSLALAEETRARTSTTPTAPEPITGVNELYTTSSTQMLAASASAKKDGATVRASFVPAEAFDAPYYPLLSEAKLTFFSDTSTSLTRLTLSAGVNPFNLRGPRGNAVQAESNRLFNCADEPDKEARTKCNRRRQSWQWSALRMTPIPAATLSFAVDIYPSGSVQDKTDPSKSKDAEPFGGFGPQLNLTFLPHERFQIEVWGSVRRARASGDPGTKLSSYFGGGATVSGLAWSFFDRDQLEQTSDYYHDGFIPGLTLGASGQGTYCNGGSQCAKARTEQASATLFADIRVKPTLQVRVAVPIVWYRSEGTDGTELAPVLTVAGLVDML